MTGNGLKQSINIAAINGEGRNETEVWEEGRSVQSSYSAYIDSPCSERPPLIKKRSCANKKMYEAIESK